MRKTGFGNEAQTRQLRKRSESLRTGYTRLYERSLSGASFGTRLPVGLLVGAEEIDFSKAAIVGGQTCRRYIHLPSSPSTSCCFCNGGGGDKFYLRPPRRPSRCCCVSCRRGLRHLVSLAARVRCSGGKIGETEPTTYAGARQLIDMCLNPCELSLRTDSQRPPSLHTRSPFQSGSPSVKGSSLLGQHRSRLPSIYYSPAAALPPPPSPRWTQPPPPLRP